MFIDVKSNFENFGSYQVPGDGYVLIELSIPQDCKIVVKKVGSEDTIQEYITNSFAVIKQFDIEVAENDIVQISGSKPFTYNSVQFAPTKKGN